MTNYLYNGVELPALPAWNKAEYPYAYISVNPTKTMYFLFLCPIELIVDGSLITPNGEEIQGLQCTTYAPFSNWGEAQETVYSGSGKIAPFWSNHDILNTDGSVYLAASDPIPLDYNTIIRWDGNTEGRVTVDLGGGVTVVKVSDYVMSADEMRNCVIGATDISSGKTGAFKATDVIADGVVNVVEDYENGVVALNTYFFPYVESFSNADVIAELGGETGTYILAQCGLQQYVHFLAYNAAVTTPTLDRKSYLIGYLTGQALRRNRGKRVATMYSYNGTVLPKLPEWDRKTYPYCAICKRGKLNPGYHFWAFSEKPILYWFDSDTVSMKGSASGTPYVRCSIPLDGTSWSSLSSSTLLDSASANGPFWSNYDAYIGNTLYLAASNPIPVYE